MLSPSEACFLAEQESTLAEDNARRSACDRCRGQKLRCERLPVDENAAKTDSPPVCRRCHRAGAICITSVQLRSGRPRRDDMATMAMDEDDEFDQNQPPRKRQSNAESRQALSLMNRSTNRQSPPHRPRVAPVAQMLPSETQSGTSGAQPTPDLTAALDPLAAFLQNGQDPSESNPMLSTISTPFDLPGDTFLNSSVPNRSLSTDFSDFDSGFWSSDSPSLLSEFDGDLFMSDASSRRDSTTKFPGKSAKVPPSILSPIKQTNQASLNPNCKDKPAVSVSKDRVLDGGMRILGQLNLSATREVARINTLFRTPSTSLPNQPSSTETLDDERRALVERTVKDSDRFTGVLKCLAEHVTPMKNQQESQTIFGNEHSDALVTLQLVTLYVSFTKLYKAMLEFIEDTLPTQSTPDFCQKLCGLPGLQNNSSMACSSSGHLQVRMFVEMCLHLMDVMHRRLELLADTGRFGTIASDMLRMVLGKTGARRLDDGTDIRINKHALKDPYRAIVKQLEEILD